MKKGKNKKSVSTKSGKLRSYSSYVRNATMKIDTKLIGTTFKAKRPDPDNYGKYIDTDIKITKARIKRNILVLNKLQGSQTESKLKRSYMKEKGFKKIRITSKSSNKDIRRALKNQKIYNEAKARFTVEKQKKLGNKITLKKAREQILKRTKKYEGVGGSW